jgi:hypothetical protein
MWEPTSLHERPDFIKENKNQVIGEIIWWKI